MPIEGELTVRLAWDGRRVTAVGIKSSRPFAAARILTGRIPADAAATVPMLFAICGGAQGAAAAGALSAAGATDVAAEPARHAHGVALETIQEYCWRILIDWPQAMGFAANATPVAAVRHAIAAAARNADGRSSALGNVPAMRELGAQLSRLAEQAIYGIPPAAWLEMADRAALDAWIARGSSTPAKLLGMMQADMPGLGRSDVALMPAPTRESLLAVIVPALDRGRDFERAPDWEGRPVETGALARAQRHPLVAAIVAADGHSAGSRFVARLVDLARLLGEFATAAPGDGALTCVQSFPVVAAEGLAAVQTARGLLLHRARIDGGRVADYRIVAPTEWNFHPRGALAQGLAGLDAGNRLELEHRARLAVQALDPCVACRIEVEDA